ncbi:MAG: guanylate kinase [Alphaproteobacteria bacterium]|nr:guanylate kinase [Alphaproteobacteria bacterium]
MKEGASGNIARRGLLLVLSSPSGAGKTTLSRRMLELEGAGLEVSVSATTRAARPGEVDGIDYRFVDADRFERMREAGELLEWAEVFGNFYGTPRDRVEAALAAGQDMLFDVDWQGARALARVLPDDVVRVFVLPPSANALENRLMARNQDSAEVVAKRMAQASSEISHWDEYDYVIVNDDVERSLSQLQSVLAAERLKRVRRSGLAQFVAELQRQLD